MLFMSTLERLRNVEELLLDADTPLRKRLLDAGRTFWSVARRDPQWPLELREAADRIRAPLVARGGIARSVQAMADECVEETAGELLRFARSAAWLLRNPAVGESAYRAEDVSLVPFPLPRPAARA